MRKWVQRQHWTGANEDKYAWTDSRGRDTTIKNNKKWIYINFIININKQNEFNKFNYIRPESDDGKYMSFCRI